MKKDQVEHPLITGDSTLEKPEKFKDMVLTTLPAIDSNTIKENFYRNISNIPELRKGHRNREKKCHGTHRYWHFILYYTYYRASKENHKKTGEIFLFPLKSEIT